MKYIIILVYVISINTINAAIVTVIVESSLTPIKLILNASISVIINALLIAILLATYLKSYAKIIVKSIVIIIASAVLALSNTSFIIRLVHVLDASNIINKYAYAGNGIKYLKYPVIIAEIV